MSEHKIQLVANEGIFQGLSKQNMLFHQCVAELIDNGIAAQTPDRRFRIDIIIMPIPNNDAEIDLYVADNCCGMNLEMLSKALQLGVSASTQDRLNEHGFGLKNALATLSGRNGPWQLWSRTQLAGDVTTVMGPFMPEMIINDNVDFPNDDFLPEDMSTLIKVSVKLSFFQSVQGRGAPTIDLASLRMWLIEHLGIFYRGYLEQAANTFESRGTIVVSIRNDHAQVPPVHMPLGNQQIEYFEVELGGNVVKLEYHFGTLDEVKRETLVRGSRARFYYQKNQPTQGIDIRLGKRTIATRQFETIWKTQDGKSQLSRHNNYNEFLGELYIPQLPRGVLTTTNNKSDFNLDDVDWMKIFTYLNENFRPVEQIREKSESSLKNKWIEMLKAVNPDEAVTDEHSVWPTATKIDVYRKTADGKIIIYELKVGSASPIHLYQLKMYWDGLVIEGEQPKEAILLVEDYSLPIEEMANRMNTLPTPNNTKPYNFKIEKHSEKGL